MDSSNSERNLTEPITLDNQIKIQKFWEDICQDLQPNFLSPSLISRGILSPDESREILKEKTRLKQNEKFLHLMIKGDNHTYDKLLSCLQDNNKWLADQLVECEVTETDRQNHIDSIKKSCTLPQYPACFEGRSGDVQKVTGLLLGGHRLVNIKAFGGQGKTALATVIGHQFISTWGIRSVMVDLSNIHTEKDVLRAVLSALSPSSNVETEGISTRHVIENICREVSNYFKKILIIFDNCESALNAEEQQTFLALLSKMHSNCKNALVLCTSRDAIVLPNMTFAEHPLESLSKEASVTLLRSYRDDLESVDGETLAAKCGFMALLIHTVGVLLSWGCSAAELLNELASSPFTLKTDEFDTHRCINLTYRRLKPNEQKAFQLLSFFPSTFTSDQAIELLKKDIEVTATSNIEYRGLLQKLCKTSFLNYDGTKKTFAMHSVIQAFAKHGMLTETADAYRLNFISFMGPNISKIVDVGIREASFMFEMYRENFVQCTVIFAELTSKSQKLIYSTMRNLALRLNSICRYSHALSCYKTLLEVQQQAKNADKAEIAYLLMSIGSTYGSLGNDSYFSYYLHLAVDIYEKLKTTYDYTHYHSCCYRLGLRCLQNDSILDSLKWFEKCLMVSIKNYDVYLQQVDQSFIARIKARQGEKEEVLIMLQEILEFDPELDGNSGGLDCTTLDNAAIALQTIGKNKESLFLLERALSVKEAAFGELTGTAITLSKIGRCKLSIGDVDGAVVAYQRVLNIYEKIHGEHHEFTANAIYDMAEALSAQGKDAEALLTYQRAIRLYEEIMDESESKAHTLYIIGLKMLTLGESYGAVTVFQRALDIYENIHGENHEYTAITIIQLARALARQGKYAEAVSTNQRALRIYEEILSESESTAKTLNGIGVELLSLNEADGAVNAIQRALDICRNIHGERHEYTVFTSNQLALAKSEQGKHAYPAGTQC